VASTGLTVGKEARDSGGPTYSRDVAPIMLKNCASCHRPGEIAPMSLLNYKESRPWARASGRRLRGHGRGLGASTTRGASMRREDADDSAGARRTVTGPRSC
jgi:hypothetical protein